MDRGHFDVAAIVIIAVIALVVCVLVNELAYDLSL